MRLRVDFVLRAVQADGRDVERREPFGECGHRHDGADIGVAENEAHALGGKSGIEGHIGGVGLEHAEQRHIGLHRLVEQEADAVAGLDAAFDQIARELVGAAVERLVSERAIAGHDRNARRGAIARLLEQMMQPFARPPAHGIVVRLAGNHRRPRKRGRHGSAGFQADDVARIGHVAELV